MRDVLGPRLAHRQIFLHPRLIATSRWARGGALSCQRVLRFLRNTLRERDDVYVTTFFDLYALDSEFPGRSEVGSVADPLQRASMIEVRFADAVIREAGCRDDRFFPHIQPYEFEALLFADIDRLIEIEAGWKSSAAALTAIRTDVISPEHINDGTDTHPAARLKNLLRPSFEKVLHGPAAAAKIGIDRIGHECKHFAAWLKHIEALTPLLNDGS